MEISQEQYFNYAIPALAFFFAGVFLFNKDFDSRLLLKGIDSNQAFRLGYILIFVSFFFELFPIAGLSSFTKYLRYSGAFCLLFTQRAHIITIVFIYVLLLMEALRGSVFVDFFVISTYLFFFIALKYNFSFWVRLSFIVIAVPVLVLVHTVKKEYRKATWSGQRQAGTELFRELAEKNLNKNANKSFLESEGTVTTVGRLTQGWHLGLTLRWVPRHKSFVNGEEIISDVKSSVLPRALFENKKVVGSQDKFYEYTGHILHKSTSMTIGVLGDFYINFGKQGSYIALFIFGALLAVFLRFFIGKFVIQNPINIVWIPFLFNYLMRANNDFYMVFNSLLKGFILFIVITYLEKKLWPQHRMFSYQR